MNIRHRYKYNARTHLENSGHPAYDAVFVPGFAKKINSFIFQDPWTLRKVWKRSWTRRDVSDEL